MEMLHTKAAKFTIEPNVQCLKAKGQEGRREAPMQALAKIKLSSKQGLKNS
jgi:hypothetical protein